VDAIHGQSGQRSGERVIWRERDSRIGLEERSCAQLDGVVAVGLIVVMFWLYGKVTPMGLFAAAIAGFLASWGGVLTQGIATAVLPPRTPGFVLFVIPCFLTGAIGAAMGLRVWWSDVKERRATGQVVDADLS
jgi:hypothetical protein